MYIVRDIEFIDSMEYAIMRTAEVVKTFLQLPCFWFKNVTVGQALLGLIALALIFWLFWDLLGN